jgi:hypothetical protein
MAVKISQPNSSASNSVIEEFELVIGTPLPADYRAFLLTSNGGDPEPNEAAAPPPVNTVGVRRFYGILPGQGDGDLKHHRDAMTQRVPPGLLPIAEDDCGNRFCLSVRREDLGCLYFWDHELEADEGEPPTFANLFKIANSFHAFFEGLQKPAPVALKKGQVKKVWVDPDFLAELKKKQ